MQIRQDKHRHVRKDYNEENTPVAGKILQNLVYSSSASPGV